MKRGQGRRNSPLEGGGDRHDLKGLKGEEWKKAVDCICLLNNDDCSR